MRLTRSHSARADGFGRTAHVMAASEEGYLDFVFPSALKRFCRHLLTVAAGCDVCCVLQCSGDDRRPTICCPN